MVAGHPTSVLGIACALLIAAIGKFQRTTLPCHTLLSCVFGFSSLRRRCVSLAAEGGSDARGADGGESGEAGDREGRATEGNTKQEHHLDRSPLQLSKSIIHLTITSDRFGKHRSYCSSGFTK